MENDDTMNRFKEMKKRIEKIELLLIEIKELGQAMPVVDKNVLCIQSFTHALGFGISDLADLT
ncbi:MAG: hypothetical protein HN417_11350 [Desulfobacula sp.]|jgi:hypothetical protein|nr:hypothetical protein [Desulfobacula sp.]MBT6338644.1 hypothetical protein [Desulfobacula sp.]